MRPSIRYQLQRLARWLQPDAETRMMWGAWLNPSPDKRVIAPRKWFNAETPDTRDLIPAGWTRI
jgi:hypothetical protein